MPRILYLILLFVGLCRVVSIAAPLVQQSAIDLCVLHDRECSNEDSESDKSKYESKEENCVAYFADANTNKIYKKHYALSDNKLLKHNPEPTNPPPNVA